MDVKHIVIYKGADHHSSFPEIIRLQNDELLTVFRQAPARPGTGVHGDYDDAKVTHLHQDISSRAAVVRSLDDGLTWDPASFVIVDPADHVQDHNLAMIAQVSTGEVIVNNMRMFCNLTDEDIAKLEGKRTVWSDRPGVPFNSIAYDSLYMIQSSDNGHTWGPPQAFGIGPMTHWSHTGQTGIVELPDGTWLAPFHGNTGSDPQDRVYIARSRDRGQTWGEPSTVACDPEGRIGFVEPPLLRLQSGRLLTVMRTAGADGFMYQTFSDDDGWTWQGLQRTPMWGSPCNLIELRSGRILCTYGYRREPYGVRACFSDDQG